LDIGVLLFTVTMLALRFSLGAAHSELRNGLLDR